MEGNIKGSGGNVAPFCNSNFPWKKAESAVFTDGTYTICPTAGYVISITCTADATGPGTLIIYDGHNAAGRPVWADQALAKHAHGMDFKVPIYCDRGITIVVAATTIGMSIQWIPGPR